MDDDLTSTPPATKSTDSEQLSTASDLGKYYRTKVANSDVSGFTLVTGTQEALFFPIGDINRPSTDQAVSDPTPSKSSVEDLFPHWSEKKVDAAAATYSVRKAHSDLEKALVLGADDILEAANLLGLAVSSLFQALPRSKFNPAFYSAVSFSAWALRNEMTPDLRTEKLSGMAAALLELRENPFLDFTRASEIIGALRAQQWRGDAPAAEEFRRALEADDSTDESIELRG